MMMRVVSGGVCGIDQLHEPSGVAVESGPDGFVYMADKHNGRVVVFLKQYLMVVSTGGG